MITFFLMPVYLAVHAYLYWAFIRWLSLINPFFKKRIVRIITAIPFFLLAIQIYIAFFLNQYGFGRFLKIFSNNWLAVVLYATMTIVLADIIMLIAGKVRKKKGKNAPLRKSGIIAGILCIIITASVCTYGFINAGVLHTTHYEVDIDKDGGSFDELNIVMVADLHMGYDVGCGRIQNMVDKVNAQNPDLIIIAGDIFDNDYDSMDDPERLKEILSTMTAPYGIYCVYGNHDVKEKILGGFTFDWKSKKESDVRMDQFIEDLGWTFLSDEYVLVDNSFYIYGRPDYSRPNRGVTVRKTPEEVTEELDTSLPIICIDHQPRQLDELSDAGVDLDLSGHTHDGQFFPMNLTSKIVWRNSAGLLKVGNMTSIVTSGVGLYGPNVRVCTQAEICQITVKFK